MRMEVRTVRDYEEFTRLVEGADTFAMQGFVVFDLTARKFINERGPVQKVIEQLPWARPSRAVDRIHLLPGGWWIICPMDYPEVASERLDFKVDVGGHTIRVWAMEAYLKRIGAKPPPYFRYTNEFALKDGTLYCYTDNPAAPALLPFSEESE